MLDGATIGYGTGGIGLVENGAGTNANFPGREGRDGQEPA